MTGRVDADQRDMVAGIVSALSILWPDELRTNLLNACLGGGETAAEGWRNFTVQIGDPKPFFENDRTSLKGILPLLHSGARRNGFTLEAKMWTYLRSAALREELRNGVYRQLCREVIGNLVNAGMPVIALKACALAETVYESPEERHCHAIELMVPVDALSRVSEIVHRCDYREARLKEVRPGLRRGFRHEFGLPLVVHGGLFDPPIYGDDSEALWAVSRPATITDVSVRVLSPSHNLLHVLATAFHDRARGNLRWVCDAWLLMHAENGIDWQDFLAQVRARRLELPILVMLRYLVGALSAEVPETVLEELMVSARGSERPLREAALSGGLSSLFALRQMWTRWQDWPEARRDLLRFLILPSAPYVRWRFGADRGAQLPFLYPYRPVAYVSQRLWWRVLRLPGFNRLTYYRQVAAEIEKLRA